MASSAIRVLLFERDQIRELKDIQPIGASSLIEKQIEVVKETVLISSEEISLSTISLKRRTKNETATRRAYCHGRRPG